MDRRLLPVILAGLLFAACSEKKGGTAPADAADSHELRADTAIAAPAAPAADLRLEATPGDAPATFPGGTDALHDCVRERLRYPESARSMRLEGRVIVRAVVDSRGRVGECGVFMSASPVLDAEALRVVKTLPPFNPRTLNGKAVADTVKIPVFFRLDK